MSSKKLKTIVTLLSIFPYYTKQNLAAALGKNRYSLDYTIKSLIKGEILIPLKRGVYSTYFYLQKVKAQGLSYPYLYYLANILREPSYVSLETILSQYGVIPDESFGITSVTIKSTRIYNNKLGTFIYRTVKRKLFLGFKEIKDGPFLIKQATKAKALFDYFYLKSFKNINVVPSFLESEMRINWNAITGKDIAEFAKYTALSKSKKMKFIAKILKEEWTRYTRTKYDKT